MPAFDLTTDELHTLLDALAFARDAKLKQRDIEGTEPVLRVLYDGDALPHAGRSTATSCGSARFC